MELLSRHLPFLMRLAKNLNGVYSSPCLPAIRFCWWPGRCLRATEHSTEQNSCCPARRDLLCSPIALLNTFPHPHTSCTVFISDSLSSCGDVQNRTAIRWLAPIGSAGASRWAFAPSPSSLGQRRNLSSPSVTTTSSLCSFALALLLVPLFWSWLYFANRLPSVRA